MHLTSTLNNYDHKPVKYDVVQTNKGSGYSVATGVFTAPEEGAYVFIWHAFISQAISDPRCELYIYRNGAKLQFSALADARGKTSGFDTASSSVVLYLNIGDIVGIRTEECHQLLPIPETSFSGFKI